MRTSIETSTHGWRWRLPALLIFCAIVWVAAVPVVAQTEDEPQAVEAAEEALHEEIGDLFRVLQLRDGVLLEPRSDRWDFETLEVGDGTLAVDGEAVSVPELRELLGDAAEPVLSLFDAGEEGREALFAAAEAREEAREERSQRSRQRSSRRSRDTQVIVGSDVTVDEDEIFQEVVVFASDVKVKGEVKGDAASIGGSTYIEGVVRGSAVSVGGSVHLSPGAVVREDVVSVGGRVHGREHADVHGQIVEIPFAPAWNVGWWPGRHSWDWRGPSWDFDFSPMGHVFGLAWDLFGFVVLLLLAFLVVLLAGGAVETIGRKAAAEPWKSGLVGLLAQILFIPLLILVVLILTLSIVGIPLLLLVPFGVLAVILVAFLGLVGAAWQLGRWLEARFGWRLGNPYVAVLAGLALLHVWTFIGELLDFGGPVVLFSFMFLAFGALVKYVAWTVGLGAALLTRAGTAGDWRSAANGSNELPPLPEPEPDFEAADEIEAADAWESEEPPADQPDEESRE